MGLRLCCSGGIWSDRPRRFSPPCRSGASRTGRADDPRSFRSGRVRLLSGRKRPECGADAIACGLVTRKTSSLGRDWPGRGSTRPAASAGGQGGCAIASLHCDRLRGKRGNPDADRAKARGARGFHMGHWSSGGSSPIIGSASGRRPGRAAISGEQKIWNPISLSR